jgi:hypothetical protein
MGSLYALKKASDERFQIPRAMQEASDCNTVGNGPVYDEIRISGQKRAQVPAEVLALSPHFRIVSKQHIPALKL